MTYWRTKVDDRIRKWLGNKDLTATACAAIVLLALAWLALFSALLTGVGIAIANMISLALSGTPAEDRTPFIVLAALTATLGAVIALPFTILRTRFAARQTKATEENLITDRINAAVASLGAEKTVKRQRKDAQGRPIFETDKTTFSDFKTKEASDEPDRSIPAMEEITLPNLEVRIGAILALERLSVKNCGADPDLHVQIMEILCAYIRENAPANNALPGPKLLEGPEALDDADRRDEDGKEKPLPAQWATVCKKNTGIVKKWRASLPPIRTDIMTALQVISRRGSAQRHAEATARGVKDIYHFDKTLPDYGKTDTPETDRKKAGAYREVLSAYNSYRPDLRRTNLQRADLANFDLRGIRIEGARLQGANLAGAQLQGADLEWAQLQGAFIAGAQLQGANLWEAQLQGAFLVGAQLQRANLWEAQLQGAFLVGAQLQGADLGEAQLQGAFLVGAQLQGADLGKVQIDELKDLSATALRGAALRSVNDTTLAQLQPFWLDIFADGTVQVPEGQRPAHWETEKLNYDDFHTKWHDWQASLPKGWDRPDDELPPEFFDAWQAATNP